ncbi:MAG: hypothetical protein JXJ04_09480, partial [Spirochaetales bacterium]|nr:hypothetical protein [Spirochaetales bacterium]
MSRAIIAGARSFFSARTCSWQDLGLLPAVGNQRQGYNQGCENQNAQGDGPGEQDGKIALS